MRGIFVVVEGLDGSGGTTQVRRLGAWLRASGPEVVETCEPTRGPIGRFIRQLLGDPASEVGDAPLAYLFAADRQDHLERVVEPALARGAVVVSDRYLHSSLAYQSLAVGMSRVRELNAGFRAPDLTIFLDLAPEACLARIEARGEARERFEALDRLRAVAEGYASVLQWCEARGDRLLRLDATATPDALEAQIRAAVAPLVSG